MVGRGSYSGTSQVEAAWSVACTLSYLQISVCDVLIMKILQTIEQRPMERIVQRMRSPCYMSI